MNLRERAREAMRLEEETIRRQQDEETAKNRAEQQDALQREMQTRLGLPSILCVGSRTTIDGLTFTVRRTRDNHYRWDLFLVRPCPKCGNEVSELVFSLASLGYTLESEPYHICPEPETAETEIPPQPTPAERLIAALKDWMQSEGYGLPF